MNEADPGGWKKDIDSLRQLGVDKFDPVRFFYLEVLVRRMAPHHGPAKRHLEDKLAQALVNLRENFDQAQVQTRQAVEQVAVHHPQAVAELQRLHEAGEFVAVKQGLAKLHYRVHGTALGELTRQLRHHRAQELDDSLGRADIQPTLQATRYFRDTWAKLSADKRLTQALGQAPKNAGPINSHMLVLRSLAMMRDISPDYFHRQMSYVDTLLGLEPLDKQKQTAARKTTEAASGKKPKSRPARGPAR